MNMKQKQAFVILCTLALMLSVISCNSKPKKSRRPVASIKVSSEQLRAGENLQVKVVINPKNGELKNADLYLNNELIYSSKDLKFQHTIENLNTLGQNGLKLVATKTDGVEGVSFKSFNIIPNTPPEELSLTVVREYPHSSKLFTQGFEIVDGKFYEGTGGHGESVIQQFDLKSGKVYKKIDIEDKYFGEGITVLNNKLYQLTYKSQKAFVYDLDSFARIDSFFYNTPEGWGLTNDGEYLIKSSGSEYIEFINPLTFKVVKSIAVCDNIGVIKNINELEYHDGVIYANVWTSNFILKIDAKTGQVLSRVDCSKLYDLLGNLSEVDVLNGIAIDKLSGKIYVTGKYWDKIFEVKFES